MTDLLREVFSAERPSELADSMSIARGSSYFRDGRVELGRVGPDTAEATVRGTMPYRVELGGSRRSRQGHLPESPRRLIP